MRAIVFVTDDDGDQLKCGLLEMQGKKIVPSEDNAVLQAVLDTPVWTQNGYVSEKRGHVFLRALPNAYSGQRVQVVLVD